MVGVGGKDGGVGLELSLNDLEADGPCGTLSRGAEAGAESEGQTRRDLA